MPVLENEAITTLVNKGKKSKCNRAKTLEPQETHFQQQQHHSYSSLMEASCESEILELELSKMETNAKLEIVSNDVISCDLVT